MGDGLEEKIPERVPAYSTANLQKVDDDLFKPAPITKAEGETKKHWSALLSHAASAVARCVKEKKISLESAKSKVMMAAIHDMYKVYHGKRFSG
jgi:hypothetical protein